MVGMAAITGERFAYLVPVKSFTQSRQARLHCLAFRVTPGKRNDSLLPALCISRRNRFSDVFPSHQIREVVALSQNHRKPGPNVIENARAKRQTRLDGVGV